MTKAARQCVSGEIRWQRGKRKKSPTQAAAIAYVVCRRKGFRSIPKRGIFLTGKM